VSVMDHEQTMGVSSRVLDQKQQNIFGHISLFWSMELKSKVTLKFHLTLCLKQNSSPKTEDSPTVN